MAGQLEFNLKAAPRRVALSVTQLVRLVRETLEFHLDELWVAGEISNARLAPSNHFYFTLKDSRSSISAVMFNSAYRRLRFRVNDGAAVIVRGRVNLYETRGTLQFYAEEMEPRGLGALQLAYEQLKQRLGQDGLFDAGRKRPLPALPRTVGIVTALGGAALRDMLRILLDRFPNLSVVVRPALVQGVGAGADIAEAIDDLNRDGRADVIIAGRGGGSLEDLWAFNEEVVARAIFASRIPVISAVGHEIDYSIADFVGDARAPTPTAAAQMAVPAKAELRRRLDEISAAIAGGIESAIAVHRRQLGHLEVRLRDPRYVIRQARQRLDETAEALGHAIYSRVEGRQGRLRELVAGLKSPAALLREQRLIGGRLTLRLGQAMATRTAPLRLALERHAGRVSEANLRAQVVARRVKVETLRQRLNAAIATAAERKRARLRVGAQRLDAVSPLRVLERGYAVAINPRDGRAVVDASTVEVGDDLDIRLHRGRIVARTTSRQF